jgi:hypothetical protein
MTRYHGDERLIGELRAEIARLREAIDTADWLLHEDRKGGPGIENRLTKGERVKRDVVELLRAALAVSQEIDPMPLVKGPTTYTTACTCDSQLPGYHRMDCGVYGAAVSQEQEEQ